MRIRWLLFPILISTVGANWSGDELALYDLVEDLGANFYDFFGITKEASIGEIKKAYRRLSLEWHPDRNSADGATDKFRQVVSVYEILKSKELRETYNNVLEFGLPDWRQPIYYYRKMRKFTWYEALIVMLVVGTLAHYLMMWAAYYEKKLVLTQNVKKSRKKKGETEDDLKKALETALSEYLPQPSRLLPILLFEGSCGFVKILMEVAKDYLFPVKVEEETEEEPVAEPRRRPAAAPRPEFRFEMATDLKAVSMNDPQMEDKFKQETEETAIKQSGAGWTLDELTLLIRLSTEKFPPGTPARWDLMARALNRSADDVTVMAGKLKHMKQEEYCKLLRGQTSSAVNESSSVSAAGSKNTPKTDGDAVAQVSSEWSQGEQKLFENALQKYPKGTDDRWGRVADMVGTKSKEHCMSRFKQLAEMVRRRKAAT